MNRIFKNWTQAQKTGAATVLLLFFGIPALTWISELGRKVPPSAETHEPTRATLEGVLVCLPHAPGYPPTKECALGLRGDDGTHYAIDFVLMSSVPEEHRVGDRVTAAGVLVPVERLSADRWRKYDIKAIFSVTDAFRVLDRPKDKAN